MFTRAQYWTLYLKRWIHFLFWNFMSSSYILILSFSQHLKFSCGFFPSRLPANFFFIYVASDPCVLRTMPMSTSLIRRPWWRLVKITDSVLYSKARFSFVSQEVSWKPDKSNGTDILTERRGRMVITSASHSESLRFYISDGKPAIPKQISVVFFILCRQVLG
jgi:hypothetical protein